MPLLLIIFLFLLCTALFAQQFAKFIQMNKTIFCIIICCFCIFACKAKETEKPKEEIKETGNIGKTLNLSLLFGGKVTTIETICCKEIETSMYPYSINVVDDSIIFTAWAHFTTKKEFRGKLTDEQYLKIKKMVSDLKQEYETLSDYRLHASPCVLKIDGQVRYKHKVCEEDNPEFSNPRLSPMPKEIWILFRYIVDLSPLGITPGNDNLNRKMTNNNSGTTIAHQKGTLTDTRDGKVYKTTKIGEQVWFAENLNYEASGSKCYKNEPESCKKYGRLYNWETAKTACPNGWHLPFRLEWDTLTDAIGGYGIAGKRLKSTSGWDNYGEKSDNDQDKFGFSALPGGIGKSNGDFGSGRYGFWWSATEYTSEYRNSSPGASIGMLYYSEEADYYRRDKDFMLSVRCVQD